MQIYGYIWYSRMYPTICVAEMEYERLMHAYIHFQ